ncbi:MAG: type II toxin-antitoxin system death-on-curing family toxin [Pseudomonadota bacterium]
MSWQWIDRAFALAVHDQQVAIHGGGPGLRDAGLFNSALTRPQNLAAYSDPDLAALAASYAFGLARNHPFVDGNKRTALVVCETFIVDNGHALDASEAELVVVFQALAAGEIGEDELAGWLRERIAP